MVTVFFFYVFRIIGSGGLSYGVSKFIIRIIRFKEPIYSGDFSGLYTIIVI